MIRARFLVSSLCAALALSACASGPREPAPVVRGAGVEPSCQGGVTVQRGDTLYSIARACGTSVEDMARANGLRAPYDISPGQRLTTPRPPVYTVRRGDNLYRVALAHDMTVEEVARLNGLRAPYTIYPGQEIVVRGEPRAYARTDDTPPPDTRPAPGPRPTPRPAPQPAPQPAPVTQVAFQWPVDGAVVGRFRQDGERLDGIRIAARVGQPVHAAADGEVVYANNEIPDYGQLVLIKHSDRLVTAYGLNSRLRVQQGQTVRAGDHIADAGVARADGEGVLHFEIRRGVTPIDPLTLLPRRSGADS
ncbi:MAG: M23 family metallopeptidase [Oceanicaulis sp.]